MIRPLAAGLALCLGALAATPAPAEPEVVPVRGTVAGFDGADLTLHAADGAAVRVRMGPRTRVLVASGARVRDIKPESYLGVLAGPGPAGRGPRRAGAVTLFAPSERGFEAGRRAWAGAQGTPIPGASVPGATLTGGWVAELADAGPGAARVTLRFEGGEDAFTIPAGTPITQVGPGERALLVPGAAATALTQAGPDGVPEAALVVVGRRGAVPGL